VGRRPGSSVRIGQDDRVDEIALSQAGSRPMENLQRPTNPAYGSRNKPADTAVERECQHDPFCGVAVNVPARPEWVFSLLSG
jgi:hypothetical protein